MQPIKRIFVKRLFCLLLISGCLFPFVGNALENERVMTLKTAYLFRFSLFVEWQQPITEHFVMCVADDKDRADFIQKNLAGQYLKNQLIKVVLVSKDDDLKACRLLYLPRNINNVQDFLIKTEFLDILTFGESVSFYQQHGMIYLYEQNHKIKFFINRQTVKKSGLDIRAQLMTLSQEPSNAD